MRVTIFVRTDWSADKIEKVGFPSIGLSKQIISSLFRFIKFGLMSRMDFAMSRPIVVIVCMFGSSKSWGLNSTHCFGTYVPVEEPSTASEAEVG